MSEDFLGESWPERRFADTRSGDGDRYALLDIKEGHNRTKISRTHLPSKASVLGNCPRCWLSQPLSALAKASKSSRGNNSRQSV